MTLKLILYFEQESATIDRLCLIAVKKQNSTSSSIFRLKRLLVYLDCLVETLYLNPDWRHPGYTNHKKAQIVETLTYRRCKERIDEFAAGDITKMLAQMTIDAPDETKIDRWDKAYFDILGDSGVGEFCQRWFNMLRQDE
jgi:hypothetical protein